MAVVNILDVARLCNLDIWVKTLDRIEVQANCPFCAPMDTKRHLYLNTENHQFHCQRCKVGGDATRLYELMENLDRDTAFSRLINDPSIYVSTSYAPTPKVKQYELKPLEERHAVYLDFLKMLKLSSFHRQNLRNRGLSDAIINGNMYKTVPLNIIERNEIVRQLLQRHDLEGIPGFYYHEQNREWRITARAGFFIPICTKDNLIQGLQIRLDDTSDKKYRWFSSSKYENGCGATGWIHVVGDTSSDTLYLTEGGLKADAASFLTDGALFAARPGVGAIKLLEPTLKELRPKKIICCDDMDRFVKPEVMKVVEKTTRLARRCCTEMEVFNWSPHYKGIDDYLLYRQQCQYNQRAA